MLRVSSSLAAGPAAHRRELAIGTDDQAGGVLDLAAVDRHRHRWAAVPGEAGRLRRPQCRSAAGGRPGEELLLQGGMQEADHRRAFELVSLDELPVFVE